MMNDRWRWWRVSGLALLGLISSARGAAVVEDGPPSLEGPTASGELLPDSPTHEAFLAPGAYAGRVAAPKSPPPPIVERPTDDRPNDQAQWVAGYWTWDPTRPDFAWVAGAWRVPPPDQIWVNGRWQRDAQGWSRVPGFWSSRRAQTVAATPTPAPAPAETPASDWRTAGPPSTHPADEPGNSPSPDAFYVPGHYAPEGDRVVWKPGFWTRTQPGWDWVPARWVRRPTGWDYRVGAWVRDRDSAGPTLNHTVARPRPDGSTALPPAIVESEPARTENGPGAPASRPPDAAYDPIAGAEDTSRARDLHEPAAPVVVVPPPYGYRSPYGYPYPYPAPYGYYGPVSPRAYIPYGVIPPFARRILNRVLP